MALIRTTDTLTLHGMEALQQALIDSFETTSDEVARAVSLTIFAILTGIRAAVPRDTGLLASTITSVVNGLTGRIEIGVAGYYWPFLEFGTVRMAARPFIRTSAEAEAANFERRIRDIATRLERGFGATARAA